MTAPPKRRWFRFGLRTLFVLMTAIACWLGYSLKWIRDRREFARREGVEVVIYPDRRTPAPWMLSPFGEAGAYVVVVAEPSLEDEAASLYPESRVLAVRDTLPTQTGR